MSNVELSPSPQPRAMDLPPTHCASVDCGWGRIIFGQTFPSPADLIECLLCEEPGQRDIAVYVDDPHVVLSLAPSSVFLDPSHTYRLSLSDPRSCSVEGLVVRPLQGHVDIDQINRICAARGMLPMEPSRSWPPDETGVLNYLLAEDPATGAILGAVTGLDHVAAFADPQGGSSLWCVAVDPQASQPGIGEMLVVALADLFRRRGRMFMDLSVLHDNAQAIALYEKLGLERAPTFTIKTKNAINEKLFVGPPAELDLNTSGSVIADEARRRGIAVEVLDVASCMFRIPLFSLQLIMTHGRPR